MSFKNIEGQEQDVPSDPWLDMLFSASHKRMEDARSRIEMRAEHNGEVLGFDIVLPSAWGALFDGEDSEAVNPLAVHKSGVIFYSKGEMTKAWVRYLQSWPDLSESYLSEWEEGFDPTWCHNDSEVTLDGIHLEMEAAGVETHLLRLKVFHQCDPYFEAFLTLDIPNGAAALNEKDPEYRNGFRHSFIRAFG